MCTCAREHIGRLVRIRSSTAYSITYVSNQPHLSNCMAGREQQSFIHIYCGGGRQWILRGCWVNFILKVWHETIVSIEKGRRKQQGDAKATRVKGVKSVDLDHNCVCV